MIYVCQRHIIICKVRINYTKVKEKTEIFYLMYKFIVLKNTEWDITRPTLFKNYN